MATITRPHRSSDKGQIALESALFCLECEIIFVGEVSCPRCTGEAVWPLAEWVHPIRSGAVISKREDDIPEISQNERYSETTS
jgi:hypothetical protein